MLLYVTGGLAFANIEHKGSTNFAALGAPPGTPELSFSDSGTRWGWTVGAGVEYALSDRISFKSEALYVKFQDASFGLDLTPLGGGPGFNSLALSSFDEMWSVRMGLNFKFGGDRGGAAAAPMK